MDNEGKSCRVQTSLETIEPNFTFYLGSQTPMIRSDGIKKSISTSLVTVIISRYLRVDLEVLNPLHHTVQVMMTADHPSQRGFFWNRVRLQDLRCLCGRRGYPSPSKSRSDPRLVVHQPSCFGKIAGNCLQMVAAQDRPLIRSQRTR